MAQRFCFSVAAQSHGAANFGVVDDFNFRPDSAEYRRIVGPDSDGYGRLNNLEGFFDAWVATGHAEDEGVTCGDQRIDFIFVPAAWRDRIRSAWIDGQAQGSDHQPIGIELDV